MRSILLLFTIWLGTIALPASAQPICICLKCVFGGYQSFYAPSGSMKPTLEPDQCVMVDKRAQPTPGDIIVFEHPLKPVFYMFRLIASAGQRVQMVDGVLYLDGSFVGREALPTYLQLRQPEGTHRSMPRCPEAAPPGDRCEIARFAETLPNGRRYEVLDIGPSLLDNTALFTVPEGHVFVMGDNRDNAADSRIPASRMGTGFVPTGNILGVVKEIGE